MTNPWSVPPENSNPQSGTPETTQFDSAGQQGINQVAGQPHYGPVQTPPQNFGYQPPQPPKSTAKTVLLTLLILLTLVAIGIGSWVGYTKLMPKTESTNANATSVEKTTEAENPVTQTVTVSVQPTKEDSRDEDSTVRTVRRPDSPRIRDGKTVVDIPSAAKRQGLTENGWSDNSATRCLPHEQIKFAAKGTNAWITVCQSGNDLIYRSDVFDGNLRREVDKSRSNPELGQFVVDANPSEIHIKGSNVTIYTNGQKAQTITLPSAWIFD